MDVIGLNSTIGGVSTLKVRKKESKRESQGNFGMPDLGGRLWFYEMRAEARAQVVKANPGITACLNTLL